MKTSLALAVCAVLAVGAAATAQQVTFDFENVTLADLEAAGWIFHDDLTEYTGTIRLETEIVRSGSQALRLGYRDLAYFPVNGQFGTLELWFFDHGYLINNLVGTTKIYGPTFGFGKTANPDPNHPDYDPDYHPGIVGANYGLGGGLTNASYLDSDGGYGYEYGATTHIRDAEGDPVPLAGWAGNQSWWSASWMGGGRPSQYYDPGTGTGGAWTHWSITYETSGQVVVQLLQGPTGASVTRSREGAAAYDGVTPGGVDMLFLFGGRSAWDGAETWYGDGIFDDITWTPLDAPPACIPGDANCDGVVDLDDFVELKRNFGAEPATWEMGDFNGDGKVDLDDFVILKNNFGATAVPEPMTLSLLALGGLAVLRRRT